MTTEMLSPTQRKTVAIGLTVASVSATLLFVGWLLTLVGRFFAYFAGVFLPLAVAAILAFVLKPYFDWLHRRGLSPILAVLVVYLTFGVPVVAFMWFFGGLVFGQVWDLTQRLPEALLALQRALARRWPALVDFWNQHHLGTRLAAAMQQHGDWVSQAAGLVGGTALSAGQDAARIVAASLSWVVFPVYLTLFLMSPSLAVNKLNLALPFLKEQTRRDVIYLAQEFVAILVTFFRGQLLIALAQAVLLGVGFALVGLKYGMILGFVFGFLNIIPYLGSTLTVVVALPLAMLQPGGGLTRLVLAMVVILVVQTIEAYALTPRIMGSRTGLPRLAIIVAIFFWGTALNGIAGMILAIPLTAFLVVFWRLAKAKYIKAIV